MPHPLSLNACSGSGRGTTNGKQREGNGQRTLRCNRGLFDLNRRGQSRAVVHDCGPPEMAKQAQVVLRSDVQRFFDSGSVAVNVIGMSEESRLRFTALIQHMAPLVQHRRDEPARHEGGKKDKCDGAASEVHAGGASDSGSGKVDTPAEP